MSRAKKAKSRAEELIEELLEEYKTPDEVMGENGLLKQLTKSLVEKMLEGEMNHHLGYEKNSQEGNNSGNSRNGKSQKKITGEFGAMPIEIPRDRNATFEPEIIQKNQTRFEGFDDKIISLYSRGMTTRDIKAHLEEMYGAEISADLVSTVTNSVMDEVREWQGRPLDAFYPIVYLDALYMKIRDNGHIRNKAVYLVIGVNMQGHKEVLGLWTQKTEGAKFWLQIVTELKNRGVEDILIACVDGLKGFPGAINAVFPQTLIQRCIVHMVRDSLRFVPDKDRRKVAADLKPVYHAATEDAGRLALEIFGKKWDNDYPMISQKWISNWGELSTFFEFPNEIRRVIYTTNAIESMNMGLRKVTKNRASFPNDEAALKLLYLALRNMAKKWTMPIKEWGKAVHQFAIRFDGRVPLD